MSNDILFRPRETNFLVIGFFTPDYRSFADVISKEMQVFDTPHHLFGVEKKGEWSSETMRKPEIVLNAFEHYPETSLVLVDVDCHFHGDIRNTLSNYSDVDVSCAITTNQIGLNKRRYKMSLSSRVMIFNPTSAARNLLKGWKKACDDHPYVNGDEPNLAIAFSKAYDVRFKPLAANLSGRENNSVNGDTLISHYSVSGQFKDKNSGGFFRNVFKR